MIHVFYGDDLLAKKNARDKVLKNLGTQDFLKMSDVELDLERLDSLSSGSSFFGDSEILVLSNVLENTDAQNLFLRNIEMFAGSNNVFILIENKISKDVLDKLKKWAKEVKEFKKINKKEIKGNPFAVANSVGRRDKKNAWLDLAMAFKDEVEPEQVSGIIFWKIKKMIIEGSAGKWREEELKEFSSKLIKIYHESHRGNLELRVGLEQLILERL